VDVSRRAILFLLIGIALFFGWKSLSRAAQETVVLRTIGVNHEDHYATLWVVDDNHYVWIRAEDRMRRWLSHVRENPDVELRRHRRTFAYRAALFDSIDAQEYVDSKFREKYGFADWLREHLSDRDTLPIRLEIRR
jgi:hypothetical protein